MASAALGKVYLIPTFLDERSLQTIPPYVTDAVKECHVFFVENERSARRFLKQLWKEMVIDNYEWFAIHKAEEETRNHLRQQLQRGKTIGILSEAGCPGVADPGQLLVATAQEMGAVVKPFVGPSSILLALMASGMNGQQFKFNGYLPIDAAQRNKLLKELEAESIKNNCTQLFIETPYRNNQLIDTLLTQCRPGSRLCIAVDLTGPDEVIKTHTIAEWQKRTPDIHKKPAMFLLLG
ncbi:SAM-dependent methyltransferase [Flavihumibacter profundi]|uniref:SAM-dependent methyltransferase n=1 Tax=Flavihumibacter profundi TaxID=2716883 RepID=UPI001CC7C0AE|nr:SAM-dependent methyltransferase [Flavihumibacter profundi]MBZ5858427.1 SAM-dependent methyltransferase [Flavihumibacter profundi]